MDIGLRRAADHRARFGGGGEQFGGLGLDDFQIGVLIQRQIVGAGQLQNLALSNDARGMGQNVQRSQGPRLDHQLERAGEQKVSDQNAGGPAPDQVSGNLAPAQRAAIDHIIMQKGRGMDELDRCRQLQEAIFGQSIGDRRGLPPRQPRRRNRQQRPQSLAARHDQMFGQGGDHRHRAVHPPHDQAVDARHIRRRQTHEALDRTDWPGDDLRGVQDLAPR